MLRNQTRPMPAPPADSDFLNWTRDSLERLLADVEAELQYRALDELKELQQRANEIRRAHGLRTKPIIKERPLARS